LLGAFATVYAGTYDGKPVAIKELQESKTGFDAFVDEAKLMLSLPEHPNIVQMIGVFNGCFFVVVYSPSFFL
jgi:serine/threonine protein kinase